MAPRKILVAHANGSYLERLVPQLSDMDLHVVGPARTARMALMLAAQCPPDLALIGKELAGRRDGHALAEALRSQWGVPSVVLDTAEPEADALPL